MNSKEWSSNFTFNYFMTDGGPYHIETTPLIRRANKWFGFCMIGTSVMKELRLSEFKRIN